MRIDSSTLTIRDLGFSFAGNPVLSRVDLDVAAGEVVVLIGRNGAGKSTLLRCGAGWSSPSEGRVEVFGTAWHLADRNVRSQVVLVADVPSLYDDLTGLEHIRFVLRANHLGDREDEAARLLDVFGLSGVAGAYPSTYSRGMRYKLALVLALAMRPGLLLLDEPFGSIDPVSADGLWRELRALARAGGSVLLSSHVLPMCAEPDRYYALDAGVIVKVGLWGGPSAEDVATLDALLRSAIGWDEPPHAS
ncbi:MAG: ABC transporter ATP-binding protein [Coriobacteriia bacterium]|nr:ABC transporter ATP-binding protein [Coriobacteriia bacterium]